MTNILLDVEYINKLKQRISELEAKNERLQEAHERNALQARKVAYDERNHYCGWRKVAEAIISRSDAIRAKIND